MHSPQEYVKGNDAQRQGVKTVLKTWRPLIQFESNERILDVGCGPGDTTSTTLCDFLRCDAEIVGCDVSKEMIDYAKTNHETDRIKFKVMDIASPNIWSDWEKEEFDKIFSFYCLHWVEDQRQAIYNMKNLLKPNGYLGVVFVGLSPANAYSEFTRTSPKWAAHPLEFKLSKIFTTDDQLHKEYTDLLKQNGFDIISSRIFDYYHEHPTVEHCLNLLSAVMPNRDSVPNSKVGDWAEELLDYLLEKGVYTKKANGIVANICTQLEIVAKKVTNNG